ncbi:MAG: hypothetical protein ACXW2L_17745 [Burkholderiales bacterium]
MGALSQYIESEGVATTQISLIREHTLAIQPPRALWVPFILGRPFGVPNDAAFQERVLTAVLRLLEAPSGPILTDYAEDAPPVREGSGADQICPVSFAANAGEETPGAAFVREVAELMPWYDLACERRGRTSVGLSGIPPFDAAQRIAAWVQDGTMASLDGLTAGEMLKLLIEDLRAYYYEAAAARPGSPDASAIERWFWTDTAGGRMFLELHERCAASEDPTLKRLCATSIVPRAVMHVRQNR